MSNNPLLEEALRLAELGLRVFPLNGKTPIGGHGCLDATTDEYQIESWWERYPDANVGVATGRGIAVIDVDFRPGRDGRAALKGLARKHGWPKTVAAKSGGGGRHFFFGVTHDMGEVPNSNNRIARGIELLYTGRYVVAPPSVHPVTGRTYEWIRPPDESTCEPLPRWLVELNQRETNNVGNGWKDLDEIREGEGRNNYLTSYAGYLRRGGSTYGEIYDALVARNLRVCKPPLSTKELSSIARSVSRYKPEDPMVTAKFNDIGNAERLVAYAQGKLIFVPGVGWHFWSGKRWKLDEGDIRTQEEAKQVTREIYNAAQDLKKLKPDIALELHKWASKSSMKMKIDAFTRLARSQEGIVVKAATLDQDHFRINLKNGTFNLQSGELEEHQRKDLLTNLTRVTYDDEAECPLWELFVEQVLPNPEVREYIRRAIGYSLTGSTNEQCFFLMYGSGSNGKSTFIETVRWMLGSYASQVESAALMSGFRAAGAASPDLMKLRGPRFVVTAEASEGARLNEAIIKNITGQDTITARALYKDPVEFVPHFKLWMHSNYRPTVKGTDRGIWRRVKLIPFTEVIKKPDRDLPGRLRVEIPGIFNWALRGYNDWTQWGLKEPEAIRKEVAQYRIGMNVVGQFVEEKCKTGQEYREPTTELWEAFERWQGGLPRGERIGRNGFYQRLEGLGFDEARIRKGNTENKVRYYLGIKLS